MKKEKKLTLDKLQISRLQNFQAILGGNFDEESANGDDDDARTQMQ